MTRTVVIWDKYAVCMVVKTQTGLLSHNSSYSLEIRDIVFTEFKHNTIIDADLVQSVGKFVDRIYTKMCFLIPECNLLLLFLAYRLDS